MLVGTASLAFDGVLLGLLVGPSECCTEGDSLGTKCGRLDGTKLGSLPFFGGTSDFLIVGLRLNPTDGLLLSL